MQSNDTHTSGYRESIELLRNREVRPSFDKIRALVSTAQPVQKAFPIWPVTFGGTLLVVGFIAILLLLSPRSPGSIEVLNQSPLTTDARTPPAALTYARMNTRSAVKSRLKSRLTTHSPSESAGNRSISEIQPQVLTEQSELISQERIVPVGMRAYSTPVVINGVRGDSKSPVILVSDEAPAIGTRAPLALFISGALQPMSTSIPFQNLLSGAVGLSYGLSNTSSLIVELRRSSFVQIRGNGQTVYRDTVLNAGGNSYQNTIGVLAPVSTQSSISAYTFGMGYRLDAGQIGSAIPFAEVIVGGGMQGALTSEKLGVQWMTDSPFSIDLAVRADQLFSRASVPQSAMNIDGTVCFRW